MSACGSEAMGSRAGLPLQSPAAVTAGSSSFLMYQMTMRLDLLYRPFFRIKLWFVCRRVGGGYTHYPRE
ncbi:hypothetical protein XELAEV_18020938mg [Xenopus laevis]|uniref:Uncharacterized protein n=1 Tax=Xenopus laevis TaxID=8355 RepID=A0A974DAH4_XENLA|nr:hypothetical protein XELAEV_18020938mg [Xenopus laevis]